MSIKISLFFISLLYLGTTAQLHAQREGRQTEEAQAELDSLSKSVKIEQAPKEQLWNNLNRLEVRIGTDVGKLLVGAFSADDQLYELNTEWVIGNHFFIPLDFGYSSFYRTDELNTFFYESEGTYLRFGLAANLLFRKSEKYGIVAGLNFANANYSHSLLTTVADDGYWGETPRNLAFDGLRASWTELMVGFRVPVFQNFYINSSVRIKFLGDTGATGELSGSQLPGYGRGLNTNGFELSYSLLYKIPVFDLRKKVKKKVEQKLKDAKPQKP